MMETLRAILKSKLSLTLALVALAAIFFRDQLAHKPPYDDIVRDYRQILAKARSLQEQAVRPADWAAFKEESRARLQPIVDELIVDCKDHPTEPPSLVGSLSEDRMTHYIRRPLLQIGRDELPRLIGNGRSGTPLGDDVLENQIRQVENALEAIRLGPAASRE